MILTNKIRAMLFQEGEPLRGLPVLLTSQCVRLQPYQTEWWQKQCEPNVTDWSSADETVAKVWEMCSSRSKICKSGDVKGKCKVFPLQAWTGPRGFGRLRLPDFLDVRHYEGGKVVTLTYRPSLPPVFLVLIFRDWVESSDVANLNFIPFSIVLYKKINT